MQLRLLAVDAVAVQQQVGVAVFVVGEAVAEGVQHWDLQEAMCPARSSQRPRLRSSNSTLILKSARIDINVSIGGKMRIDDGAPPR